MPDNIIKAVVQPDGTISPILLPTGVVHQINVKTRVDRVRLIGMFFDLDKSFLLPSAMRGIRKVRSVYEGHPQGKLLVVGHTDTSGPSEYNDTLSLERSEAVIAYLTDDVDGWLKFYSDDIAPEKRWGAREDRLMLGVLPEGEEPFLSAGGNQNDAVRRFQTDQGLEVDGIAGPKTRRALVTAYMKLDGTSLPVGTTAVAHGCGENFPDIPTGDDVEEPRNRRVEIYVFDRKIVPSPGGATSGPDATDYPAWKAKVVNNFDFGEDDADDVLELRLHDEQSRPLEDTFYRVVAGGVEPGSGRAGADGFISLDLPANGPNKIEIEWGSDTADGPFRFSRSIFVHVDEGDDVQQDKARLHNLGYDSEGDFAMAARAFQVDYQVDNQPAPLGLQSGALPAASRQQLDKIFQDLNCDATPADESG